MSRGRPPSGYDPQVGGRADQGFYINIGVNADWAYGINTKIGTLGVEEVVGRMWL